MNSIHRSFNIFQEMGGVIGRKILFISPVTPDRRKYYRWVPRAIERGKITEIIRSLDMAWVVLRSSDYDAVVIFEHSAQYALPLYISCILKRAPVFFFVHQLQQSDTFPRYMGFRLRHFIERHFSFFPIHIELADHVIAKRHQFSKSILTPLPMPEGLRFIPENRSKGKIRIGVVGIRRPDKPILPLIKELTAFLNGFPDAELIIGMPIRQLTAEIEEVNVTFVDTSTPRQYLELLSTVDILVTTFDERSYYFRPSGVIADAVAAGCYVVAPAFSVFQVQLSVPTIVGQTYERETEIIPALKRAINDIRSRSIDFDTWRKFRSKEKLVTGLAQKIEQVILQRERNQGNATPSV